MVGISEYDSEQINRVNTSNRPAVMFVHGLRRRAGNWGRGIQPFEAAGCAAFAPGGPDEPKTVAEANAQPDAFAHKSIGDIADPLDDIAPKLDRKPAIVGHSFGGLMTQIPAGRGRAAA